MRTLWRKVGHDLGHDRRRTLLAVLSMAAGLFAVGSIFGMVDQLLSSMDRAHQVSAPSHVNMILRGAVPLTTVDELRAVESVRDIDPLVQLPIRYRSGEAWRVGTLFVRPDYEEQLYDVSTLVDGAWPGEGELAVERMSGDYFGLTDEVALEIGNEAVTFPIAGTVRHPFVEPPDFGGQAVFFGSAETAAALGVPDGSVTQLLVQVEDYSEEAAAEAAEAIRAALAQRGHSAQVTIYQSPDRHWGRMFVEGITVILQIMAVLALLMSVVLIFNTFTALMTQQVNQIGVMKAIGGGRGTIAAAYLAVALALGVLALLLSLAPALFFADGMSRWFLRLFNIEVGAFQWSARAVAIQIVAALLVPLLATLRPISRGVSMTVREALATYGLGADYGSSFVDRAVERFGRLFLSTAAATALGNMFRRKGRLLLTLLTLTTAGVMFIVVMSLVASINLTLDNEQARQRYDVRVGLGQPVASGDLLAAVADVPGVDEAQTWYVRSAALLQDGERLHDSAGLGLQLNGVPDDGWYRPVISAGRWLEGASGRVAVIGAETALENDLQIGDTVTVDLGEEGAAAYEIIGTYRIVYGGGFVAEAIYVPRQSLAGAERGTQLLVRGDADTAAEAKQLSERLEEELNSAGIPTNPYVTATVLEERQFADNQFAPLAMMLLSLALIVASVGGIGLSGALGIGAVERTREIGVMRAIGAGHGRITALFIMEALLQGLLSWMVAIPLGVLLAQPLARLMGQTMIDLDLDFQFSWPAVLLWLVITLTVALLAALAPARRAARTSVRQSLNYA